MLERRDMAGLKWEKEEVSSGPGDGSDTVNRRQATKFFLSLWFVWASGCSVILAGQGQV